MIYMDKGEYFIPLPTPSAIINIVTGTGTSLLRLQGQEVGVCRGQYMGAPGCATCGGASGAVESTQLMGVEKVDLPDRNFMYDRPVVPHRPTKAYQNSPLVAVIEEVYHLVPEFVERCLGQVLIGYTSVGNKIANHIAKNAADSDQSDSFGKQSAQIPGLFQVLQYFPKQHLCLCIPDT